MPLKLFNELAINEWFHYGDKPERKLMKSDSSHFVSPAPVSIRKSHPHVAVVPDKMESTPRKSIYDQTQGDQND